MHHSCGPCLETPWRKTMSQPLLCDRTQYLDTNTGLCSTCADACASPTGNCPPACRGYNESVIQTMSAVTAEEDEGYMMMMLVAVLSVCIAAVVVMIAVTLVIRLWLKRFSRQTLSASGDSVPFLAPANHSNSPQMPQRMDLPDCEAGTQDKLDEECHWSVLQVSVAALSIHSDAEPNGRSASAVPSHSINENVGDPSANAQHVCVNEVCEYDEMCPVTSISSETFPKPNSTCCSSGPVQESSSQQRSSTPAAEAEIQLFSNNVNSQPQHQPQQQQQRPQRHGTAAAFSLVSYDVEARMKMFGWLNSQSWVIQYFEAGPKVNIAVANVDHDEARAKIREAADKLVPEFQFEIVQPLVGKYTPCPLPSVHTGTNGVRLPIAADKVVLTPGVKIFSERMEAVAPGEKVESGWALFSGSIKLHDSIERGLTVGHLFERVGLEYQVHCQDLSSPVLVGKCYVKIDFVDLVDSLRKTTADLALLDVFCHAENSIVIEGTTFVLKLYQGFLGPSSCSKVAILSDSGHIRYGQMDSTLFTVSALGLYNTLSIVDSENQWSRVNNPGDSGALVISVPDATVSREVVVFGMVIGYFESEDGTQSKTVATRLWDILNYVNKMSYTPCDLESGYESFLH